MIFSGSEMCFLDSPWRRFPSSILIFVLLLISHHFQIVNAAESFQVSGPDQPVVAVLGEDAVLPCHLLPAVSVEEMQVRWFRTQFNSVVYMYENGMDQDQHQLPEYRGRTEFIKHYISCGGVSLRIHNIGLSDEGTYTCYFQLDAYYGEATVELKVAGLGTEPSVSVTDYLDRGIRVLCESAGWYPEPEVSWRQEDGQSLTAASETETQEHNGQFNVRTSLLRTSQYGKISCHIRNSIMNQERESSISLPDVCYQRVSRWVVSLSILLVSMIIVIALLIVLCVYCLKKERREKEELSAKLGNLPADNEKLSAENKKLSAENKKLSAENAKLHKDNTQLSAEKSKLSGEAAQLSAENENLSEKVGKLSADKKDLDEQVEKLKSEKAKLSGEVARLSTAYNSEYQQKCEGAEVDQA